MKERTKELEKEVADRKRSEEELQKSKEQYKNLVEMLPEAVFETDKNLEITFANRRAFEMFGYSKEDLKTGKNGFELITLEELGSELVFARSGPSV